MMPVPGSRILYNGQPGAFVGLDVDYPGGPSYAVVKLDNGREHSWPSSDAGGRMQPMKETES